ncbi:transcriptional regulator, partial [Acinetobacter ursingii]
QIEILSILALCPQGLNLETLHQALYGERTVSMGTLKAEMSQLRDVLGGMLGSRPYRLLAHVEADFLQAENALDSGYVSSALQLYT